MRILTQVNIDKFVLMGYSQAELRKMLKELSDEKNSVINDNPVGNIHLERR